MQRAGRDEHHTAVAVQVGAYRVEHQAGERFGGGGEAVLAALPAAPRPLDRTSGLPALGGDLPGSPQAVSVECPEQQFVRLHRVGHRQGVRTEGPLRLAQGGRLVGGVQGVPELGVSGPDAALHPSQASFGGGRGAAQLMVPGLHVAARWADVAAEPVAVEGCVGGEPAPLGSLGWERQRLPVLAPGWQQVIETAGPAVLGGGEGLRAQGRRYPLVPVGGGQQGARGGEVQGRGAARVRERGAEFVSA